MSESTEKPLGFETLALHAGQSADSATNSRAVPIYQTTSYVFNNRRPRRPPVRIARVRQHLHPDHESDHRCLRAAHGRARGRRRRRSRSPPGRRPRRSAILNIARAGDDIVSTTSLYGGTYNLFHYTLPKMGINVNFVEPDTPRLSQRRSRRRPRRSTPRQSAIRT